MSDAPNVFLVLIFPDSTEGRWVWEPPRVGSTIKSRLGKDWRIEEVLQSGIDIYTVHCVPHSALPSPHDLAADLLGRARKTLSPRWRRRRSHHP